MESDDEGESLQYKVIVVGDGAVGKTSLINRFCEDAFQQSYKQTIGLDFYVKRLTLPGNVNVTMQIWDIGGQQIGGKMLNQYIFGSHAVVLAYDVTNADSFKNLEEWFQVVRGTFSGQQMPYCALTGNKIDLNHLRVVKAEKHSLFAVENQLVPFLVSAKSGEKVGSMFYKIAADLSGVQLTKAEMEVAERCLTAHIVDHASAPAPQNGIPRPQKPHEEAESCTVS